ncbi:hypothetical protein K2173_010742 [Erythroxylum novogranatense]|uniref:Uncharacterized protein n=1 Tax=Erythroxylum novogranatense TaxID=1862640 RepID=A0AAV8SRK6_9ROSI|nr:hypothetical protein K2173_010742 [Erythroxylum novogranatense]
MNVLQLIILYLINLKKQKPKVAWLSIWLMVVHILDSKMIYLDGDIQSHTPQYEIGYHQQLPNRVKWLVELGPPSLYFNVGMFVLEPSLDTYEDLLKTLKLYLKNVELHKVSFSPLCSGIEAIAIHWERGEHVDRGHDVN